MAHELIPKLASVKKKDEQGLGSNNSSVTLLQNKALFPSNRSGFEDKVWTI